MNVSIIKAAELIYSEKRLNKNSSQVPCRSLQSFDSRLRPTGKAVLGQHHFFKTNMNGAEFLVKALEAHGVTHVFGIPGAKVDSVFTALLDSPIELVLCRHEQNAAFMAQAFGRLTGRIGVCLATSGPGVTNLVTGLATATTEGDPVLAIGGEVPLDDRYKHTHQSLDAVALMRPVTRFSQSALSAHDLPEVLGNAIRAAEKGRLGAAFLGLPKDVGLAKIDADPAAGWGQQVRQGPSHPEDLKTAADILKDLQRPLLLLGMQASDPCISEVLQTYVQRSGIPYCATFQGPGCWVAPEQYVGRLGLFRNQPADALLDAADGVICIGFDPVEYDPSIWNSDQQRPIVNVDVQPADQDRAFLPRVELIGDLQQTLIALATLPKMSVADDFLQLEKAYASELQATAAEGLSMGGAAPVHPLRLVHEISIVTTEDTTLCLDVGSHYIWMNRYAQAERARQVLVSNGQQTLGVALPWAIAAGMVRPGSPVISVSGDGGFLFTATELETAMRMGSRFVHVIWNSNSYNMVEFQEQAHYERVSGIQLGDYDVVKFAESFGAKGYTINHADELGPVLRDALTQPVPALINVPVDYSDNIQLMQNVHQEFIH